MNKKDYNKDILTISSPLKFTKETTISNLISEYRIFIMYEGHNRNGSYFAKDVINSMVSTLGGTPVVGYYSEKIGDFTSHLHVESTEVDTETSVFSVKEPTPYGFIPENPEVRWEKLIEDDGTEREYLTCNAYLWNGRYEELNTLNSGENNQSMELNPDTVEYALISTPSKSYYEIRKAEFLGLCILGKEVEPAFESASIVPSNFSLTLKDMHNELITAFAALQSSSNDDSTVVDEEQPTVEDLTDVADEFTNEEEADAPETPEEDAQEVEEEGQAEDSEEESQEEEEFSLEEESMESQSEDEPSEEFEEEAEPEHVPDEDFSEEGHETEESAEAVDTPVGQLEDEFELSRDVPGQKEREEEQKADRVDYEIELNELRKELLKISKERDELEVELFSYKQAEMLSKKTELLDSFKDLISHTDFELLSSQLNTIDIVELEFQANKLALVEYRRMKKPSQSDTGIIILHDETPTRHTTLSEWQRAVLETKNKLKGGR